MRRHLLAPLAVSAALAVLVAACGGSATAAPSVAAPSVAASVASVAPSAAPSTETAASPSPEASAAAAASTAPTASKALPSIGLPNQDTNLEAVLPSSFKGAKLTKFSMKGAQFLGQDPTSDFNKLVVGLGLSAADVSVAVASEAAGAGDVTFVAIRFAGADSGKLLDVFKAATQASGSLISSVNVGGKDVIKTKDSSGSFSYFYVRNDTVLGVSAKDDATATAALALLP